ncbi:monocarboxylate transporter 14-like [Haliotis asinina]|uniref:monocarboxylate transporter 14-like n=1 Tax=Haliotis asinina TaxID=109174 RepID=UPI003531C310
MDLEKKEPLSETDLDTSNNASQVFLEKKQDTVPEGGWGWVCVLGRFYTHFLLLGSVSAFGIIYIELIDYFHANRTEAAWVGSLAGGLSMFVGPLSGMMTERLGCRLTTMVGAIIASLALFSSWFANGILYLCITYGVIAGTGLGLMFIPSAVIIFQYFEKKRGFASAIGSTGGGIGAMVLPLVYTELIAAFGWRGTMWIISGLTLNAVVCGAVFRPPDYLKKRKVTREVEDVNKNITRTRALQDFFCVFKDIRFSFFALGTLFCYFGYGVPIVHMPDLALQSGVKKEKVAYLLSIMGIVGVVLRIPVAWVSDFPWVSRTLILGVALLLCGVGTVLCPFLTSFPAFAMYSAVQGGCMGIWGAFLGVIVADLVGLKYTNRGIGFLIFAGGVATIISSPLAGWMYDVTENYMASFFFAGVVYIASGVCTLVVFFIDYRNNRKASHKNNCT